MDRGQKRHGREGAGRDKRSGGRPCLRVDKRGKERESEWKWKEYAVTGSLWLRCLVYHNTRPSVRGSADWRMHRDPPRNGSNVSEDRENPVVDGRGSRPLKGRAAWNTRDILSSLLSPLSVCLCYEVVPVVLLHDVERTIARICWKLCRCRIRYREEDGQVGGTRD